MLSQDAMNVLVEIVARARSYLPSSNTSDPNENKEILKNSYLTLKSALCVGDETSLASTGFTFILKGTDEGADLLEKLAAGTCSLEDIPEELEDD